MRPRIQGRAGALRHIVTNRTRRLAIAAIAPLALLGAPVTAQHAASTGDGEGRMVYQAACANCHGADGRGAPVAQLGFDDPPLPDFTDCSFASREPAQDWEFVVRYGGPVRAFSRRMPAFGKALTPEQVSAVVAYVRTFCGDRAWPRGELNLPRPLIAEKAFPEDEIVVTSAATTRRGARAFETTFIYEKRFGARNQYEVVIPLANRQTTDGWSGAQLGDVVLAVKRAVAHDGARGRILSVGSEVILPTGSRAAGVGSGTPILEPFLLGATTVGANGFVQFATGVELPASTRKASREAFATIGAGTTFLGPNAGRSWSPIVEVAAARELEGGADLELDVVPQFQVSLSRRQHILFNVGVRLPMTDRARRPREILAYFLWDWFDGGLRDGW